MSFNRMVITRVVVVYFVWVVGGIAVVLWTKSEVAVKVYLITPLLVALAYVMWGMWMDWRGNWRHSE